MILSIIIATLAVALPFTIIRVARRRAVMPQIKDIRSVDLRAFRNLMDPDEEEYLRTNLAPADFRRIQRERLRAAVEYIRCAASNAAVLMHVAEAARRSPDPATAQAAVKVIDNATRLRSYAFQAIPKLYLGIAFPSRRFSPARVEESYEQMTRQAVLLGLQYPISEISAAL
ncbi:MAG: hypothetical protein WAL32_17090 [Terriglobales bacterium]